MAKKQIVARFDRTLNIYELEGRLIDVIAELQLKVDAYGPETELELEYGYEGIADIIITYPEEETDKELERRLARGRKKREKNKAERVKKEARDRKELERLQKKYG